MHETVFRLLNRLKDGWKGGRTNEHDPKAYATRYYVLGYATGHCASPRGIALRCATLRYAALRRGLTFLDPRESTKEFSLLAKTPVFCFSSSAKVEFDFPVLSKGRQAA